MKFNRIKISSLSKNELEKLVNESNSFVEILAKLGYNPYSGNHRTLKNRLNKYSIDIEPLKERSKIYNKERLKLLSSKNKIQNSDIFVENSKYLKNCEIKKKLIQDYNFKNLCSVCSQPPEHNGKSLTLQLDHINGISNDNRIENLRLLCPNCHSQTDTFSGKNIKSNKPLFCNVCKKEHSNKNRKSCSEECKIILIKKMQRKKISLKREELLKILNDNNWNFVKASNFLNVSDNGLRKACKRYNIPYNKKTIKEYLSKK